MRWVKELLSERNRSADTNELICQNCNCTSMHHMCDGAASGFSFWATAPLPCRQRGNLFRNFFDATSLSHSPHRTCTFWTPTWFTYTWSWYLVHTHTHLAPGTWYTHSHAMQCFTHSQAIPSCHCLCTNATYDRHSLINMLMVRFHVKEWRNVKNVAL